MSSVSPLTDLRVLEFAGLAPGPFAGLLLSDYGASVLRIDRPHPSAHTSSPPPPTSDLLTRHKSSICIDLKSSAGLSFFKSLLPHVDIVIDPFRPGVLEKLGLSPQDVMLKLNPRLIIARMTGFRRDGKYKDMAGHDINYLAVSGVLSMLGPANSLPYAPANILGDFAGGGAMCFLGILLGLVSRNTTAKGQVVEANMVDGSAYLTTFPRLLTKTPTWNGRHGTNLLDGGCPYYGTYETKDGKVMAVGALEPQFFAELLNGLQIGVEQLGGSREDKKTWPGMRSLFEKKFKSKTRTEWEAVFDGKDACCTPVFEQRELEKSGFEQRAAVTLSESPGLDFGKEGWTGKALSPGIGGEKVLSEWIGWQRDRNFIVKNGGLEVLQTPSKL
ncbi:MAG: Isopenicillin N epimerase component 2 [Cirrosporium novae-zelandiae]|nr:MAG: Isopenicillin N epimerase component 2 [Cirrosporium novae-zelandiae]